MAPELTWPPPDGTFCTTRSFSSASPDQLYAAWLDPAIVGKAIDAPVTIDPVLGGAYRLGKRMAGSVVDLQPTRRIVLALTGSAFPKGASASHAFLDIAPHESGSMMDLSHIGLPSMKVALAYVQQWRNWGEAVCKAAARARPKRGGKR